MTVQPRQTQYRNADDFFDAWQRAVSIAGEQWFECNANPPTSKWDLRPDYGLIVENVGAMSSTERVFLLALYSFYHAGRAGDMAAEMGISLNPGLLAGCLDERRLRVLADLTISYEGW